MTSSNDQKLQFRHIEIADLPAIADLLHVGFPIRSKSYWEEGLRRFAKYTPPEGVPKLGYLLASGGIPVGVLLLIFSNNVNEATPGVRCNVSSWYVRPDFRAYAPLLVLRAIKNHAVTYVNVWPANYTLPTIETQGFTKAAGGLFAGVPALGRIRRDVNIMSRPEEWNRSKFISASRIAPADGSRKIRLHLPVVRNDYRGTTVYLQEAPV